MILQIKIRNYLSFKEEVTFSFEASSDNNLEDYYVAEPVPGVRILKMMMIYGANASGKSILLKAFGFLWSFVRRIPTERDKSTHFIPFRFDKTINESGSFELIFYTEKIKHKYYLEIDNDTVYKEALYFYPGSQPALIFDRQFDSINQLSVVKFGAKIKISEQALEAIQLRTLRNMSLFAAYSQINLSVPELTMAYHWFRNQFMPPIDPYTSLTEFSDQRMKDDVVKQHVLEFLNAADMNITNVHFEEEIKKIPDELVKLFENGPFSIEDKNRIIKEKAIHLEKKLFEHCIINNDNKKLFMLPEDLESRGTLRYYGLSAPFYETITSNSFLPIDEIGTALHPLLVLHFIKEFLLNSKEAQLLFTTHNLSLLNEKDIIRKDAVWFTEKGIDGVTSIYSLADFSFRKELSYYNAYKHGKFGAIPNLED